MLLRDAACLKATDEEFKMAFGDSEDSEEPYNDEHAEYFGNKFCSECPVMTLCLEDALLWKDKYGVRGWTTPNERSAIAV